MPHLRRGDGAVLTILALTEPGDRVMIHTPVYDPFYAIIQNTGREVVDCGLIREGGTYRMDFERMEEQMKQGWEASDSLQSHNPTGRVWRGEELARVAELCVRYGVYLASMRSTVIWRCLGIRSRRCLSLRTCTACWRCTHPRGKTFSMTGAIVSTC